MNCSVSGLRSYLNIMRVVGECQTAPMQFSSTQMIDVVVNGQIKTVPEGLTLLELLRFLSIEPSRVAIELNRSIVRRPGWDTVRIETGAQLEIVQFVGGG